MYRMVNCDYEIIIIGEMECMLDLGETRTLSNGEFLFREEYKQKDSLKWTENTWQMLAQEAKARIPAADADHIHTYSGDT